MKNRILLSIIMPVYGVEKYIKKCLESVLEQLTDQCELIIINDCTKDSSIEICKEMIKNFNNVKIIEREKNGGLSAARNTGIKYSEGKFCWFIDSDDHIADNAINTILFQLKKNPSDILFFNHYRIDENSNFLSSSKITSNFLNIKCFSDKEIVMGKYLTNNWGFEVWSKVFSLDIIKENELLFEPNIEVFAEDICFFIYFINYCKSINVIDDYLYYYLIRDNSIMRLKKSKVNEMVNLVKKCMVFPDKIPQFDYVHMVLPRLLMIEMKPISDEVYSKISDIYDKGYVLNGFKNPFKNLKKRIILYKKKEAIRQVLLMIYIRKYILGKNIKYIYRIINNL